MRRALLSLMLVGLSGFSGLAQAPAQTQTSATYTSPSPWIAYLGTPPKVDSDEGKADLAIVLWHQRTRTEQDVRRARSEVNLNLGVYAEALGRPVEPSRYPLTVALLDKAGNAIWPVTDGVKKHYLRARPFIADVRVQPVIEREASPSYPSGHATRGLFFAMVLAELVPDRREALLAQGRLIGVDRVIGGVHYPSDIEAGQRLALKFGEAWLAHPDNRKLIEAARSVEWSRAGN